VASFHDKQKTLLFFGFQLGMPTKDHASEGLSRKAQRLDSRERRGTLVHALLKTFLHLSLLLIFSLALKLVPKGLDIESLSFPGREVKELQRNTI
jgi:hypothetical protein